MIEAILITLGIFVLFGMICFGLKTMMDSYTWPEFFLGVLILFIPCCILIYGGMQVDKEKSKQKNIKVEQRKDSTTDDSDDFMNPLNPISPISPLNPASPMSPFNQ